MWVAGLILGLVAFNFPYELFLSNWLIVYIFDASINVLSFFPLKTLLIGCVYECYLDGKYGDSSFSYGKT